MFPVAMPASAMPADYASWLNTIKTRIQGERLRLMLASNSVMVLLYWDIGQSILDKQAAQSYGARVIDRLSADLREAFPQMKGFRRATSNTCALLLPHGRIGRLCSRLLHKCRGSITACSWTKSLNLSPGSGMFMLSFVRAGRGTS